jgi:DNA-binding response OmpR family regulator
MHALIIDDEEYVRLVLGQTLREEGCDVLVAAHGEAGIQWLHAQPFD